ncbi:BamA/TamA family outer membrane protein [Rhodohalobacter sp. 8-1]|uniref:BamA/TamA family outer membrane protein n=1 Tax=Rhodohalobacter sp. 8-1 TaxID=3131972 RepID=UPI0030EEBCFD
MKTIFALSTIIVGLLLPICGYSQLMSDSEMRGVNHSFYPIVGYSSDLGFFGGGLFQRIDYADGIRPFLSNTVVDVTGSTRGKWAGAFEYERTRMFGRPLRTRSILDVVRNPIYNYFGIGNRSEFSTSEFDDGLYYLLQRRINARFEIRKPLYLMDGRGVVEGVFRLKTSYTENEDRGADTRFVELPPPGADGGWVNTVGAGLIYDIRNNEFDPRSGIRAELGADFSPKVAGNDYGYSFYFAELTSYLSIVESTVFAQKIAAEHSYGTAPFYELPVLGNKDGLRGFAMNRFLGESSVLYMAELRSWLFHFFDDQVKFGGHLFFDTGRVFSDTDSPRLFDNWKRTYGFGGAMSAFNPDLIFRGELGFSEESYRIYAGIGFAF